MDPRLMQLADLLRQALALVTAMLLPTPAAATSPFPSLPEPGRKLAWGAKVSGNFRARVWWIADTISKVQGSLFDANWLMACMAFESGRSFAANKRNPVSSATGLIQFMRATAVALGTTVEALAAMTAEDQLNYVYKYFAARIKEHGPIRSLEDCYMAILWPSAMGKPSEFPLFIKGASTYTANAGLDTDKDHDVSKAEAASFPAKLLIEGLQSGNVFEG